MSDSGAASAHAEVSINAEPAQVFAFDGGCRVTERTWDRRHAEHIKLTLQRLKEKAEAG